MCYPSAPKYRICYSTAEETQDNQLLRVLFSNRNNKLQVRLMLIATNVEQTKNWYQEALVQTLSIISII